MTRSALISLALTQRRLSHGYRQWAREDERAGRLASYRTNIAEANRLVRDARWHLQRARMIEADPIPERLAA
ncbi:MAG: hypothetical protein ACOH2M_03375 [Cypionkella sp.]